MSNDNKEPFIARVCDVHQTVPSLTLRDYFAARALVVVAALGMQEFGDGGIHGCETTAGLAYDIADAMLAERESQ